MPERSIKARDGDRWQWGGGGGGREDVMKQRDRDGEEEALERKGR